MFQTEPAAAAGVLTVQVRLQVRLIMLTCRALFGHYGCYSGKSHHSSSVDSTTVTASSQVLLESSLRPRKGITVLRSLHWLPVCQRIDFKHLVYKALNDLGPKYIVDLLLHDEPSRPLRWSGTGLLSVPRLKTEHGEAAFSFYAPYIRNKLPDSQFF